MRADAASAAAAAAANVTLLGPFPSSQCRESGDHGPVSDPRCHAPPAASLAFIFSLRRRCRPPCHASLAAGLASISSLRRHRPPSRRSSTRGTGRSTPRTRAPAPRATAPIGTDSRVISCCPTMKAKKELITMMALPVRALAGVARSRAPAAHPPLFARAARYRARLRVLEELSRVQWQRHEERLCEALRARRRCAALTALQRFHSHAPPPLCVHPHPTGRPRQRAPRQRLRLRRAGVRHLQPAQGPPGSVLQQPRGCGGGAARTAGAPHNLCQVTVSALPSSRFSKTATEITGTVRHARPAATKTRPSCTTTPFTRPRAR